MNPEIKDSTIDRLTTRLTQLGLIVIISLTPLIFLPFTANPFDPSKLMLIVLVALVSLVSWVIKNTAYHPRLTSTPFNKPLLLLCLVFIVAAFFGKNNATPLFLGKTTAIISLIAIFFTTIATPRPNAETNKNFFTASFIGLMVSAVIVSVLTSVQQLTHASFARLFTSIGTNLQPTQTLHPTGSSLATLTFLLPTGLLVAYLLATKTRQNRFDKIILGLGGLIIGLALASTGFEISSQLKHPDPTQRLTLPSWSQSYTVAIETLKYPRRALAGFGPDNYIAADNLFRPIQNNQKDTWQLRFTSGSNELFTLLATTGIFGFIAIVYLLITLVTLPTPNPDTKTLKFLCISLFGFWLVIPINLLLLITSFTALTLLGLNLKHDGQTKSLTLPLKARSWRLVMGAVLIAAAGSGFWYVGKAYVAEYYFKQAATALNEKEAKNAHGLLVKAISTNPKVAIYYRSLASLNFALAKSLASAQKPDQKIDEATSKAMSDLVNAAISGAKTAVSLDPTTTDNWLTLADIYRQLITKDNNAAQWTIVTYQEAIKTDPTNPALRLNLGLILQQLKASDQAIRLFQQSSDLKNNWASPYYQLAQVYKSKNDLEQALANLKNALNRLDPSSTDYPRVQEEIKILEEGPKDQPKKVAEPTKPNPLESQPLNLPDSAAPDNLTTPGEPLVSTPSASPAASPQ